MCNEYRRMIDDFTEIAQPLNKLLRNGTTGAFELDDDQKSPWDSFIDNVFSPPALALAQPSLSY